LTADSIPSQAAATGVNRSPAADGSLIEDLVAEVERHACSDAERLLGETKRAFGRHYFEPRARSAVEAAERRAWGLLGGAGTATATAALNYAADLFVALAVERAWRSDDADRVLAALARKLHVDRAGVEIHLLVAAMRAPQVVELPPLVALDVQLSLLLALAPVAEASLWIRDESHRLHCVVSVGETAKTRRFRAVALRTLGTTSADAREDRGSGLVVGAPVRRWHAPWGALVVRARTREVVDAVLDESAAAMSPIAERDYLLERSAARERSLVGASERRLARLGFDLHDGALQQVAAVAAGLRRARRDATGSAGENLIALEANMVELESSLRELAHSLEPASLLRRPLEHVVEAEADTLEARSGIAVAARVLGEFGAMTPSQKIALIRVIQEAFTNIREHSGASRVELTLRESRSCVELEITDDGVGFEVTRTLQDAAQRGRLGLVGSSERIRLLGGTLDLRSKPGGPTTVSVTLPRWQPLSTEQETPLQLAY